MIGMFTFALQGVRTVKVFAPVAHVAARWCEGQALGLAIEAIQGFELFLNASRCRFWPNFEPAVLTRDDSLALSDGFIFGMTGYFATNKDYKIEVFV